MIVYVLTGYVMYEGATVLGVYTSRDTAETAAIKHNGDAEYRYDAYFVNEVRTDSLAKDYDEGDEVDVED